MKSQFGKLMVLFVFVVLLCCQQAISQTIVYPSDGSEQERLAAKEVRRYTYLRTDQLLSVQGVTALPGSGDVILVANDNNPMVEGLRSLIGDTAPTNGYLIKSVTEGGRDVLVIAGSDSTSTLYGAYHYAEMLGIRFFLHGDTIPDAKITLDITGFDEKGEPLGVITTRGILPFHNFPEGPDWWNLGEYKSYISQLPKMGMNLIVFHLYPLQPGEGQPEPENGPEPQVWLGIQQDVNPDGTVDFAYAAFNDHCNHKAIFDKIDTDLFHAGSALLFEKNEFGPEIMEDDPDNADFVQLFNEYGHLWDEAFTHAGKLGVKTGLGNEIMRGQDFAQGIPPELLEHLGLPPFNPDEPEFIGTPEAVKSIYMGTIDRITKAHPLDIYSVWTNEMWWGTDDPLVIAAVEEELVNAYDVIQTINPAIQMAVCGWQQGSALDPAEFDNVLPSSVPFAALWGEGTRYGNNLSKLPDSRVKWASTWMEEDWGLVQPQTEVNRVWADLDGANALVNCPYFMTKFWRTRVIGNNMGAMRDLLWCHGATGAPIDNKLPINRKGAYIDAYYLDWATQSFGSEVGSSVADIFATMDKAGETGADTIPKPTEWELESPGAIVANSEPWSSEQTKYAFVADLEALRPQVVGAGNLERFDYWLKAMQALRIMGEYGCRRYEYQTLLGSGDQEGARAKRLEMKTLWENLMTLEAEKATNSSDLGEIKNLEELNYNRILKSLDAQLSDQSGIEPTFDYSGVTRIMVTPPRTQIEPYEELKLRVTVMGSGLSHPTTGTLYYRPLGSGSYSSIALSQVGRAVYSVTLPCQNDDFEYYVEAAGAKYPVTSPSMNHTVVVLSGPPDTDPPTPDPMFFAQDPCAISDCEVSMVATAASDPAGVEYYFEETTGNPGGSDSGWTWNKSYTDTVNPETQYCYRVKARDKTFNHNETAWSTAECATTPATETDPPTPDPMTWASVPAPSATQGSSQIDMTATTASDESGVEYYFANVTDPNHDSGWQSSASYSDTGLSEATQYCYQVKARDLSLNHNETAWSTTECATTEIFIPWIKVDDTDPAITYRRTWETFDIPGAYMGTCQCNSSNGSATFSFTGVMVRFYGCTNEWGGTATIYIDDVPDATVDFYSDEEIGDVLLYESGTLSSGPHEIMVEWATPDDIMVDAFEYSETGVPPDTTPPSPDPMTWSSAPSADSDRAISMTAEQASDPSGVEYYFDETSAIQAVMTAAGRQTEATLTMV
jgi:hypothetical protein